MALNFRYGLHTDTESRMTKKIKNFEFYRMWKEVVVAYFKFLALF
jgi:hypothetical protein